MTISHNVPDTPPEPYESDSYNKGGGSISDDFKRKRKPRFGQRLEFHLSEDFKWGVGWGTFVFLIAFGLAVVLPFTLMAIAAFFMVPWQKQLLVGVFAGWPLLVLISLAQYYSDRFR